VQVINDSDGGDHHDCYGIVFIMMQKPNYTRKNLENIERV